uniref:Uncharacterized protein n=1 Tax=Palpitomonas bilix TaxID=652834 RepID=A0A7S3DDJ3_9EUKA|mmetsp:Transcript_32155/g.83631  ORF Transcript_32155/g.83631 Transcript_32155/m.83631 type:complete len:108 (+) Transcript_32155:199-522(+)
MATKGSAVKDEAKLMQTVKKTAPFGEEATRIIKEMKKMFTTATKEEQKNTVRDNFLTKTRSTDCIQDDTENQRNGLSNEVEAFSDISLSLAVRYEQNRSSLLFSRCP